MKTSRNNGKLYKIIAAVLVSAFAGGLTKHFLLPSKSSEAQTNKNHNASLENETNPLLAINKLAQWCPDCEDQLKILRNIIKNNPESIETFKKHFNKLTKEDLQSLITKINPKVDLDSIKSKYASLKSNGQNNLSKYTDMIPNSYFDLKNQLSILSKP
jgi:hypothetical protein